MRMMEWSGAEWSRVEGRGGEGREGSARETERQTETESVLSLLVCLLRSITCDTVHVLVAPTTSVRMTMAWMICRFAAARLHLHSLGIWGSACARRTALGLVLGPAAPGHCLAFLGKSRVELVTVRRTILLRLALRFKHARTNIASPNLTRRRHVALQSRLLQPTTPRAAGYPTSCLRTTKSSLPRLFKLCVCPGLPRLQRPALELVASPGVARSACPGCAKLPCRVPPAHQVASSLEGVKKR